MIRKFAVFLLLGAAGYVPAAKAQQSRTLTISSFKPNKEDAAELQKILSALPDQNVQVTAKVGNKISTYGKLSRANVRMATSASAIRNPGTNAWATEILSKIITSTKDINQGQIERLQAIAQKYNAAVR